MPPSGRLPVTVPQLTLIEWRVEALAGRGVGLAVLDTSPRAGTGRRALGSRQRIREMCEWPLRFWWFGSDPLDGPVDRGSSDAEEFGQLGLGVVP